MSLFSDLDDKSLLEKEPLVPSENELRYWFYNRYYQTETNVTV